MKLHASLLCLLVVSFAAQAQESVPLWPEAVPGALGTSSNDIPTLTIYLPPADKASGARICS